MGLNKKLVLATLVPCCSPSLLAIKGSKTHSHYRILANYNGQAELLLSLQITPDYFPYQFKQRSLYDYLTNINRYLVVNEKTSDKKKQLKEKLQKRIDELISKVSTFGPSLWNEDLYSGGLVNRNVQFWNTKSADYLFLEQFIVDDSSDPLFLIQRLPKHKHLAITNFRASRDPYSLFGEDVYKYFKNSGNSGQSSNNHIAKKLHEYYKNYSKISPNNLFRSSKYIYFWNDFCHHLKEKAKNNSEDLKNLFRLPYKGEQLFAPHGKKEVDQQIAKEFFVAVFTDEELKELNGDSEKFSMNYLKEAGAQAPVVTATSSTNTNDSICSSELISNPSSLPEKVHHPALEHQTMKGSSPISEGTQKDLLVYLSQMAIALDKINKTSHFSSVFGSDHRKEFIEKAWNNAVLMAKNYRERLKNVREYLKHIGVVDKCFDPDKGNSTKTNSKTVAIISYPPSQLGAGDASIQTVSKYPFLYNELGLNEVIPKGFEKTSQDSSHEDVLGVDDNGWWWRLGDFNFSSKVLDSFSSTADSIILLATTDDWNILNSWDSPKLRSLRSLLKTSGNDKDQIIMSNYHLWNEGLRSPIALNLLLDVLVETLTKQFGNGKTDAKNLYSKALEWGDYWENHFVSSTSANNAKQSK